MAKKTLEFLYANSALLLIGALIALVWANVEPSSYHALQHLLHFPINDIGMAFFFGLATKEVFEAIALKDGSLRSIRTAAVPLAATLGGIIGPVGVYLFTSYLFGVLEQAASGWAIPTATDIAFSYLIAKRIWPKGHPAISFLLLSAIADDGAGLFIVAGFYPQKPIEVVWMLLVVIAMVGSWVLHKKLDVTRFWPYLVMGGVSWFGFFFAGLHPALSLVPIVPFMPHADSDLGIYSRSEAGRDDTLNEFEDFFKVPVEWILFLFGLVNAGVKLGSVSDVTIVVLLALMVGKPLGIFAFGFTAKRLLKARESVSDRDLLLIGCTAGIGFTVALFVAGVAFPPGPMQDAAKIGALLSILSGFVALVLAPILGRTSSR